MTNYDLETAREIVEGNLKGVAVELKDPSLQPQDRRNKMKAAVELASQFDDLTKGAAKRPAVIIKK